MDPGHSDGHLAQVRDLLPLETIQVRLDGLRAVLQVLPAELQCVFELVSSGQSHVQGPNTLRRTWPIVSRVFEMLFLRAVSGSTSIIVCSE